MLRAGTIRLMFQMVLDLSIVIFRSRITRSYRIARRPLYWLSIICASSGRVTMSYSRDMPPMWYDASTSPVGIFADQRDREGKARGPGDNHIVFAKVGEPDKQLLVLVDAARIIGDDHRLPHSFDTQGLDEGAVRV